MSKSIRRAVMTGAGGLGLLSAPFAGVASATAAPPQTSTVVIDSTSATPVALPAVNKNFTETITVSPNGAQTTEWAPPCGPFCSTTYDRGTLEGGNGGTAPTVPCATDCLLPGAPVGAVVYRVDKGPWMVVDGPTVVSGQGPVQLAYNDDFYSDNSGTYTVSVVRNGN